MATNDLLSRAKEIKNATEIGENTAERVGGVMVDMVESIMSAEESLTAQGKQIAALQNKGQNMEYDIEQQQGVLNSQGTRLTEVEHRADEHDTQIAKVQDEKAPKVGYAPDLKVNFAKELVGRGEATPQVIGKIRPTGVISIGDGNATIERVKGKSVVWNQYAPTDLSTYRKLRASNITYTNGVLTATATTTNNTSYIYLESSNTPNKIGHKVYYYAEVKADSTDAEVLISGSFVARTPANGEWQKLDSIRTPTTWSGAVFGAGVYAKDTLCTYHVRNLRFIDLTQMFGEGNEPTTPEEFYASRPLGVTDDYNEGTIVSYQGEELKSVGFNAFNGIYAKVIGGQQYHALGNIMSIGFTKEMGGVTTEVVLNDEGRFTPETDGYVYAEGTDICIHLTHSYTPDHVTEYQEDILRLPNIKEIKDADGNQLFTYGLLSAGSVYDEITATKAVKRVGQRAFAEGDNENTSVLTDGTHTIYALTEPIEVDLADPFNMTYDAWDFGTEELIANGTTTPLCADINYVFNAVDRIRENTEKNKALEEEVAQLKAMITQMTQATNEGID